MLQNVLLRRSGRCKVKKIFCAFIIMGMFLLTSCNSEAAKSYQADGFAMGTVISQTVYGENARKAADEVTDKVRYLENLMTINSPGGDINRLNDMAGKGYIDVKPETFLVLKSALKISALSKGAFDITVGPLVKCWNITSDHPQVPSDEELQKLIPLVGYRDISLDEQNLRVKLGRAGQIADLGGIAKGYAGDAALEIYKKNGIKSAFINLGGNVVTLGTKPDGNPWSIGIQNPRGETGSYIGIVKVTDKAVVTSGDYQRYFEKDGKRYHHIIDPQTGKPADSGLISVTIIADSSTEADGLSTAAFVLGLDKGLQLIQSYGKAEAVFITADKKVYVTPGLKNNFQFSDESKEYEYVEKR